VYGPARILLSILHLHHPIIPLHMAKPFLQHQKYFLELGQLLTQAATVKSVGETISTVTPALYALALLFSIALANIPSSKKDP
jgi:hypothetical protein